MRRLPNAILAFLVLVSPAAVWAGRIQGTVVAIHDGDTIQIDIGGPRPARVRLAGTDSPEIEVNNKSQGRVAYAARDYLRSRLPIGATITVQTLDGAGESDKHNRLLGRLFYGNVDLNLEMLKAGWSVLYVIAPYDKTMVRDYAIAAREGFESRRGMFSDEYKDTEMPYQFRLRVMRQRGRNLLGDLDTRKLHRQADMEHVPVYSRIFFPSIESARERGFDY
ncbi:MAG: thermonuclease family protein [Bdellovibrionaceae bacterium]|nr:thermonuclease family protein [Pseudobdellovibrionaceae bacterium]